jgi:hypothetical protein
MNFPYPDIGLMSLDGQNWAGPIQQSRFPYHSPTHVAVPSRAMCGHILFMFLNLQWWCGSHPSEPMTGSGRAEGVAENSSWGAVDICPWESFFLYVRHESLFIRHESQKKKHESHILGRHESYNLGRHESHTLDGHESLL